MYCSNCGKNIGEHPVFCQFCGTRVAPEPPPSFSSPGFSNYVQPGPSVPLRGTAQTRRLQEYAVV